MGTQEDKKPIIPGEIDGTKVNAARNTYENAKNALNSMTYDDFKRGSTYSGLKKSYTQQGQQAMKDTLGQVAARTGGMASSYATSAANQSYNNYMQTLEDAARSLFNDEYSRAKDKYNTALGEYDMAYGEYRDSVADERYNTEWQYKTDQEAKAVRDAELEALFGAKGFTWGDWDKDGDVDDTDAAYAPDFSKSSSGEDYWKQFSTDAQQGYADADRKEAEDEVYKILEAGGTPTADLLVKAGFLDEESEYNTDKDGNDIPDGLSGLAATMWQSNIDAKNEETESKNKADAVKDIEARIANGASLGDIASDYKINDDADWKAVTGMSLAEWTKKVNDNYRYQDTDEGRAGIMNRLIAHGGSLPQGNLQNNFDYIYGEGAYDKLQTFYTTLKETSSEQYNEDDINSEISDLISAFGFTEEHLQQVIELANPVLHSILFDDSQKKQ